MFAGKSPTDPETRFSDGVSRHHTQSCLTDLITEPGFNEHDSALRGYFDKPRPANDARSVYRSVRSSAPRHCYNSTSFRYVDVSMPRVTFIDGAYRDADNDNRRAV